MNNSIREIQSRNNFSNCYYRRFPLIGVFILPWKIIRYAENATFPCLASLLSRMKNNQMNFSYK